MKPLMKLLMGITLGILLGASVDAAVGTFTFKTTGASDTVEAVSLVYPQRVPEAGSVSTSSLADGSVTPAKISTGYNVLSDAEKTQALVGSTTVAFLAQRVDAVNASFTGTLQAGEKTIQRSGASSLNAFVIPEIGVAAGEVYTTSVSIASDLTTGTLFISDRATTWVAQFIIRGAGATTETFDAEGAFTPTKDNADTLNVYVASGVIKIQNNTANWHAISGFAHLINYP